MILSELTVIIHGLTLGGIYALVALGFHVVFRATGALDFAQGDKVLLGGLIGLSLLQASFSIGVVFVVVILGGLVAGVVYHLLVIRPTLPKGVETATLASIGGLLVFGSGHILVWGATGQRFPPLIRGSVQIGRSSVALQSFLIWVLVAAAVVTVMLFLKRSRYGKAMVAASTDPLAAATVGIDVHRVRAAAAAVAFSLAGIAGLLIAPLTLAGGTFGAALMLKAFAGAILGGLERTGGVVLGALILGVLEDLLGAHISYVYVEPIILALFISVLLIFPSGLLGMKRRAA